MRKMPSRNARVTHTINDESFLAGVGSGLLQKVKTDQQVAAEAHAFPSNKEKKKIVGQHQGQHGEHEQVHVAEETVVAAFVAHVADGVDVDEEADARDDKNHDAGKRVEQIAPVGDERDETAGGGHGAGRDPFEKNLLENAVGRASKARSARTAPAAWRKERKTLPTQKKLTGVLWQGGGR